jgi:hypothetical protein
MKGECTISQSVLSNIAASRFITRNLRRMNSSPLYATAWWSSKQRRSMKERGGKDQGVEKQSAQPFGVPSQRV